ncbi:hypothetical protein BWI15_00250 [Kribbella sp. ALI-6-A]|uniref:hypothetical protein n=1 Tax=Kribbella sp. ALI-6-A TaxID=1933817 RepID=UPI00097C3727|nr:hypothetical protein [Kribbella sp. ALI-6-A]ONI79109.1 hypothetical protein BWI15_00250 [Kribbella sp. ALI-6-A]
MKRLVKWPAVLAAFALGCTLAASPAQAQISTPTNSTTQVSVGDLSPEQAEAIAQRILDGLPADFEARLAELDRQLGLPESAPTAALVERLINPADYQCGPTPKDAWVQAHLPQMDSTEAFILVFFGLKIPTYDTLLFETEDTPQVFGRNDEFKTPVTHTFRDLRRFWDTRSDDIQLLAMHSNTVVDKAKVTRTLVGALGLPTPEAAAPLADLIVQLFSQEKWQYGHHPLFSFNAYASEILPSDPPALQGIPDKLVMGDGILEAYHAIGYGDVAPEAIMAHEFGHHVQFEHGVITEDSDAETTRHSELQADALAGYSLTHARGLAMQRKRVEAFEQIFFNVGDCSFTADGHHGTPNQRVKASNWGHQLAQSAPNQGHILPSREVLTAFDQAFPTIVAPDAS